MKEAAGVFVTIEGGEGVGKSTQVRLLAERLRAVGVRVLELREPGGTAIGDRVREMLLDPAVTMTALTELFLYEAARAELTAEVIRPALARGEVVICDRFVDSTTAYQGAGRGLSRGMILSFNSSATERLNPELTVLLTLDTTEALRRATTGGADRIEAESARFHRDVAEGYLLAAACEPHRIVKVDASGSEDEVAARVWTALAMHPKARRAIPGRELP